MNFSTQILPVMLGGAFGALSRYILSEKTYELLGKDFPYGTLLVNVIGSLLLGFFAILILHRFDDNPVLKLGLLVGFMGAFTTFSTFSMDTLQLMQNAAYVKALLNMLLNVVICITAVALGMFLARQIS